MSTTSIRQAYDMWPQYNRRLREVIAGMSGDQLAIRPAPELWPIWATVGHTAGMRVYWLCDILGEPGAETTPFIDVATQGWEDDLRHSRSADELVAALDSTFAIVERCLDRWTPAMLSDLIPRRYGGSEQVHTRGSIVQRLFSHDAYHCGELSQTLGIHGLPQIDLWGLDSTAAKRLPEGPNLEQMIQLITDAFPDATIAKLETAVFFSLDEKHWPNFATIVWTDEHDEGAPSNLEREGVYRVNVGVDPATFRQLVGGMTDPDYAAFDQFLPHPVYAKQRWISILNPTFESVRERLMPLIEAGHDRLAGRRSDTR